MAEQGFLTQKPRSPGSLALVIALHGAALTALMLAKSEFIRAPTVVTDAYNVPLDKPPPPEPEKEIQPKQKQVESRIETIPPIVERPEFAEVVIPQPRSADPVPFDPGPIGPAKAESAPEPAIEPKRDPVRTEAQIDGRSRLQPSYPPAEERAAVEGSVTVIVTIGADGRVKDVERVRAASDAFYRATEQQALRHWRFKPAMVDGKPVESRKTMTVHFRLDA